MCFDGDGSLGVGRLEQSQLPSPEEGLGEAGERRALGPGPAGGAGGGRDGDEDGGPRPGASLRRMESGPVAGQMPDLKTIPCDLSVSAAPAANRSMDLERRVAELPAPLSVLGGPLPLYPDGGHQGAPGQCAFHSGALLANLGLQCCPSGGCTPR
ncbi:hypothetical protein ANANG_G00066720 [Anguilla anguilla]|uniref:Uncharacterized protein n=1 Tax=Anguilla anguilla TaxID=7936 RepID=A0A9D3MRX5_ANGAN|nr:hypothetical protein ANANG_G00066720 [Anguilla anguilla]